MKRTKIAHEFVDVVPDHLEEGVVYISLTYNTALHKCCCGCGNEVVTPISPVDWTLGYDGQAVTLKPSIGNYSFACIARLHAAALAWGPTAAHVNDP